MLPSYESTIIYYLVKKGYTVGDNNSAAGTNQHNRLSHLIAITLYQINQPSLSAHQVCVDVAEILDEMKALFYSIVVSPVNVSAWAGSNIVVSTTKSLLPPLTSDDDKSKLN